MSYKELLQKFSTTKTEKVEKRIWAINTIDNYLGKALGEDLEDILLQYVSKEELEQVCEKIKPEMKRFVTSLINSVLEQNKLNRISREEIKKTNFLGDL